MGVPSMDDGSLPATSGEAGQTRDELSGAGRQGERGDDTGQLPSKEYLGAGRSEASEELDPTIVVPSSRMIDGKYKLGRIIGEGGMGSVYEAQHTDLGATVAIKLLSDSFAEDPTFVRRFRREARAAAAVRHPNVVAVTDAGTDEQGVPFLVMELLDGESLASVLRRERVLSAEVAGNIASQVLAGLAAAHQKGVIHRDLKPANVFLTQQADGTQVAKLLDFGISKFAADQGLGTVTADGAVIGTPSYMAPEQVRGHNDLDSRIDIYAVGVLLYRMITGKLPFSGKKSKEIYDKILAGNYLRPSEVRPGVSKMLEAVVVRAMSAKREDRFQDARGFREAVRSAVPMMESTGSIAVHSRTLTPVSVSTRPSSPPGYGGAGADPHPVSPDLLNDRPEDAPTRSEHGATGDRRRFQRFLVLLVLLVSSVGAVVFWVARRDSVIVTTLPPVRYGITRYSHRELVVSSHRPLVEYLQKKLHRRVELVVAEDYELARKLGEGEVHLAALSAYRYVQAKRRSPALRLIATAVNPGGTSYEGHVLARADSGISELKDLVGKVFCYVSPNSSSGYLYPRALFRQRGMDPDSAFRATRFTGDHGQALRALDSGVCDGAAVAQGILSAEPGLSQQRFRVVASTSRIPYDAYCLGRTVDDKLSQAIQDTLLALEPDSKVARDMFGPHGQLRGFAPASDNHYDPVREIERFLDEAVGDPPVGL